MDYPYFLTIVLAVVRAIICLAFVLTVVRARIALKIAATITLSVADHAIAVPIPLAASSAVALTILISFPNVAAATARFCSYGTSSRSAVCVT